MRGSDSVYRTLMDAATLRLPASFTKAVSDSLVPRTMQAAQELGYEKIVVAGGVAANARIRADFTMYTGLLDNICPPSTQFAAYNKIPGKKRSVLLPDYGHETPWQVRDEIFRKLLEL